MYPYLRHIFIKNVGADIDPIAEYTKFNSYFTNEINKNNIKILDCANGEKQNYIAFDDGVQYTFVKSNEGIYQNEAKICRGITDCTFELAEGIIKNKRKETKPWM